MTTNMSTALRNALLDVIESTIGVSPVLELRTGSKPTACADADSGTLLASLTLPSDWMAAASSSSKVKAGTWEDAAANAAGTVGHWRLKSSGGTVHYQGTTTATGAGGDMTMDNPVLAIGQDVIVNTFTLTAPHA